MKILLKLGPDINVTNQLGEKPLNYAALFGNIPAINRLVKNGAIIDASVVAKAKNSPNPESIKRIEALIEKHNIGVKKKNAIPRRKYSRRPNKGK